MTPEHRIASGRASLATYVTGQGSPIVFLHANVCDSRMWNDQRIAVAPANTAIAYDRRGFGKTQAEQEDFSSVADLLAVIQAVAQQKPAILVGCSQGGKIAIDTALQHPALVRALVLIASSVGGAPEPAYPPTVQELMTQQKAAEIDGDLDRLNAIKARLFLDGPLAPEGRVTGHARQLFLKMNGIALRSPPVGSNLDTAPAFHRLHDIRVPTLVIWGDLDFPHVQERCRHILATIPGAEGHELAGAAHLPSLESAAITARLTAFVQRLSDSHPPAD